MFNKSFWLGVVTGIVASLLVGGGILMIFKNVKRRRLEDFNRAYGEVWNRALNQPLGRASIDALDVYKPIIAGDLAPSARLEGLAVINSLKLKGDQISDQNGHLISEALSVYLHARIEHDESLRAGDAKTLIETCKHIDDQSTTLPKIQR